jgi:ZIP family zinc transporter
MGWALLAAGVAFLSTLAGGAAALRWPNQVSTLMALAGGIVLAAAFFDLLPDAVERAIDIHMSVGVPIGAVLIGFLLFQTVEHFVHDHGEHHDGEAGHAHPDPAGLAGALGFVVHSFFDGLAIGLGFRVDSALGLLVAAAVIGHDFSDGLQTVSYLVAHRQPIERSRLVLVADAVTPMLGAIVASIAPVPDAVFPLALGFFSGLFVYAAATNLLPRAQELPAARAASLTGAGAAVMFLITRLHV